jgi:glycerol-3-phosphate dehydrogenase subunit C
MPNIDGGDVEAAKAKAAANVASLVREVAAGHKVVSLQPTCGYMIRKEWPELLRTDEARQVAEATLDVMELLEQQRREGSLSRDFKVDLVRVTYHAACHLRAQKVGYPGSRVLGAVPGTDVEIVERCSAVDGTWGMKAQHYEQGRKYAQKLASAISASEPNLVVTDCALSARRILAENARQALHPVEALAKAYGLAPEAL